MLVVSGFRAPVPFNLLIYEEEQLVFIADSSGRVASLFCVSIHCEAHVFHRKLALEDKAIISDLSRILGLSEVGARSRWSVADSMMWASITVLVEYCAQGVVVLKRARDFSLNWCSHLDGKEPRVSLWVLYRDSNEAIFRNSVIPVSHNWADFLKISRDAVSN